MNFYNRGCLFLNKQYKKKEYDKQELYKRHSYMLAYKIWPGFVYIDNVWKKDKKKSSVNYKKECELREGCWCLIVVVGYNLCMEEQVEAWLD